MNACLRSSLFFILYELELGLNEGLVKLPSHRKHARSHRQLFPARFMFVCNSKTNVSTTQVIGTIIWGLPSLIKPVIDPPRTDDGNAITHESTQTAQPTP